AIDPIRERLVMSLAVNLGPQENVLDETPEHAKQLRLEHPVLTAASMHSLRALPSTSLHLTTVPALFHASDGPPALARAVDSLCRAAAQAVRTGCGILVLSDVGVDEEHAPIPSLLAVASVHHHLIREGLRAR